MTVKCTIMYQKLDGNRFEEIIYTSQTNNNNSNLCNDFFRRPRPAYLSLGVIFIIYVYKAHMLGTQAVNQSYIHIIYAQTWLFVCMDTNLGNFLIKLGLNFNLLAIWKLNVPFVTSMDNKYLSGLVENVKILCKDQWLFGQCHCCTVKKRS